MSVAVVFFSWTASMMFGAGDDDIAIAGRRCFGEKRELVGR